MKNILGLTIGFLFAANAFAIPLPKGPDNHRMIAGNTTYHFDGIVALDDCSGSIIRFEKSNPTDPAMILTNGHCYDKGMPKPGTFVYHVPSSRTFGVFNDQAKGIGTLHATEAIYSTMTGTDITLYKLQETYQDIQTKFQAHPYMLSSKHPAPQTPIQVISGYWRRGYTCSIEAFVFQLHEAGWIQKDSIRYSRPGCEVIGGTSGSPIIEANTRNMIGINNTINESGEKCTMDNPCEVDANGNTTATRGVGYGQETYLIYGCLNASNQFDLATPGCGLFH